MKSRIVLSVLFSLLSVQLTAQTRLDRDSVSSLPKKFSDAWAQRDGAQLAAIMADDVEFVTVGATMLRGRKDFEKYHSRLLSGRFAGSSNTVLDTSVRFLRSNLALVHWTWSIEGDRDADGSARPKRFGLMTMVAEKRGGRWFVVAAQNTNAAATIPPEALDITPGLSLPKQ